jgi:serralysin
MAIQINLANYQDIDGILWGGWRWEQTNLTYSFPTSPTQYGGYGRINGIQQMNTTQQVDAVRALRMLDAVSELTISKAANPADASIRMAEATTFDANDGLGLRGPGGGETAEANPPDDDLYPNYTQGDAWFTHGNYDAPRVGNFASTAGILHELGHSLGLKHGHAENKASGIGANFILLPPKHDSQEYSVMTYRAYAGQKLNAQDFFDSPVDYPTTYMQNDIFALQYLYGADYKYNSGNTTYKWSSFTGEMLVNGHKLNATDNKFGGVHVNKKIFMTVWDGNGTDTYDFSNFSTVVKSDLAPGAWSTPNSRMLADLGSGHDAVGSIANALSFFNDFRCYIENAKGGSNNDTLKGNVVDNKLYGNGGNDSLAGRAGSDTLAGGAGADRLTGGSGADRLVGGTGVDRFLYLSRADAGDTIKDFSAVDFFVFEGSSFRLGTYEGVLHSANFRIRPDSNAAIDANDFFVFNASNDTLWFDADGNGAGASLMIADLATNINLRAYDIEIV